MQYGRPALILAAWRPTWRPQLGGGIWWNKLATGANLDPSKMVAPKSISVEFHFTSRVCLSRQTGAPSQFRALTTSNSAKCSPLEAPLETPSAHTHPQGRVSEQRNPIVEQLWQTDQASGWGSLRFILLPTPRLPFSLSLCGAPHDVPAGQPVGLDVVIKWTLMSSRIGSER